MKKLHSIALFFIGLMIFSNAYSQVDSEYLDAKEYLDKKGEVYFHFYVQDPSVLLDLTKIISIDNVKNGDVWAYANDNGFDEFLKYQIHYQILPHPGDAEVEMYDGSKGIWDFDTYPTYPEYESMMNTFVTNYPNLCQLDTIVTLASGRRILAIKITDNPGVHEDEPEFLYTGTIHGDETTGYVLFLRLIDYLLNNYGTNSRITNIVNSTEIWICPLTNPDGTYAGGNSTVMGAIRYNSNGVDLNRNYPNPLAGPHPDGNPWQPENIAMMDFADEHDFVIAANTHSGAEVFNYPWDTWTSSQNPHADDNWWQLVGYEYADTAQFYSPSGYFTSVDPDGVVEGGDWYVIYGGRQDYMQYYKHCREVTLEICNQDLSPGNTLPLYWNYNYRSFLNYIEQSLYGVRGVVTDACNGIPIKALVTVDAHDEDSSQVYSSLPVGNYHRPIYAGTYSFTFTAAGYYPQTISNITVANYATVIQNVQLAPIAPVASFTADHTSGCDPNIQFYNTTQASSDLTFLWNFGDGQTSTLENPLHTYSGSGNYNVSLTVYNCDNSNQTIQNNYISLSFIEPPITISDSACGSSSLILYASGSGTLNWYDEQTGGSLVNTGPSFNTPILDITTAYYVDDGVGTINTVDITIGTGTSTNTVDTYPTAFGNFWHESWQQLLITADELDAAGLVAGMINSVAFNVLTVPDPNSPPADYTISLGTTTLSTLSSWQTTDLVKCYGPAPPPSIVAGWNTIDLTTPYYWDGVSNIIVDLKGTENNGMGNAITYNSTTSAPMLLYAYSTQPDPGFWTYNPTPTPTTSRLNVKLGCTTGNICISPRAAVMAIIKSIPVSDFSVSITGLDIELTNLSIDASTYEWDFGDGSVSTEENPSHTYATEGNYTITLISTNVCGSDTSYQEIAITYSAPVADFIADNITPTTHDTVAFTDLSTNFPDTWLWLITPPTITYQNGTASYSQNPYVSFDAPGPYTVTLTASNAEGSDTETKTDYITVSYPVPVADFIADNTTPTTSDTVIFTDLSINSPDSWSWIITPSTYSYLNGTTSFSQHPNIRFDAAGNYTISLTASNEWGSGMETKTDYITASGSIGINPISENQGISEISVWPNPTTGILNINLSFQDKIEISVLDITGSVIFQQTLNNENTIDLSSLREGLYYITFTSHYQSKTISVLKIK